MDIASILEEYLADISTLPGDVAFILDEIKVKDQKLLEAQRRIAQRDGVIQKYVQSNGATPEHNKEQQFYPKIRSDYQECISLQQEKFRLASMGLYLLTKHVSKLDTHVSSLESEGILPPVSHESDDQSFSFSSTVTNSQHTRSLSNSSNVLPPHIHNDPQSAGASSGSGRPGSGSSGALGNNSSGLSSARRGSSVSAGAGSASQGGSSSISAGSAGAASQQSSHKGSSASPDQKRRAANESSRRNSRADTRALKQGTATTGSAQKSTSSALSRQASPISALEASTPSRSTSSGDVPRAATPSGTPGAAGHSAGARVMLKRSHESRQPPSEEGDESFCICKKGSVGNMIACDGETCEIEWFHWDCVGLTEDPKGSWYCPQCKEKIKRR